MAVKRGRRMTTFERDKLNKHLRGMARASMACALGLCGFREFGWVLMAMTQSLSVSSRGRA